jgi:hypothetical protein
VVNYARLSMYIISNEYALHTFSRITRSTGPASLMGLADEAAGADICMPREHETNALSMQSKDQAMI